MLRAVDFTIWSKCLQLVLLLNMSPKSNLSETLITLLTVYKTQKWTAITSCDLDLSTHDLAIVISVT